jgi:FeS assembly SUF system protein
MITKEQVIDAIKMVFDPEIPVNVYDLGLIYDVRIENERVDIDMTLTSPTCLMAEEIPLMVKQAVESVAGRGNAFVYMVWNPPWDISRMSTQAKIELDLTSEGW